MPVFPLLGTPLPNVPTSMQSGVPFWGDAPEVWDGITIGGISGLGLVDISVRKQHQADKQQGPGSETPEVTHLGFAPADITIRIRMWTSDHWANWQKLAAAIQATVTPATGQAPISTANPVPAADLKVSPLTVAHPALQAHGVYSLFIQAAEPPKPSATPGIFEAVIYAQEWAPKKTGSVVHYDGYNVPIADRPTAYGKIKDAPPPHTGATGP